MWRSLKFLSSRFINLSLGVRGGSTFGIEFRATCHTYFILPDLKNLGKKISAAVCSIYVCTQAKGYEEQGFVYVTRCILADELLIVNALDYELMANEATI